MLNRISGWFLFLQLAYLSAFDALELFFASSRIAEHAIAAARGAVFLGNPYFRLSDYVSYPFVFSAPVNLGLAVAFFWRQLRRNATPSIADDFFSILNTVYIASSGWILFGAFLNLCKH